MGINSFHCSVASAMLLAIDIGNTSIQMGLWDGAEWLHIWRIQTDKDQTAADYVARIRQLFQRAAILPAVVRSGVMSSVVPSLTDPFHQAFSELFSLVPLTIRHDMPGIQVNIDQPEQAGADRLVNAAAAHALYGGPAIVIDFGTATNFDVVSPQGAYIGGAIAPGMQMAHDALVQAAARLQPVEIAPPPQVIGRNTVHAMQSGIFWGYLSLIEGLVQRLRAELIVQGIPSPKIIASGGYANVLAQHLPDLIDVTAPNLLLDGLRIIHDCCNPTRSQAKQP